MAPVHLLARPGDSRALCGEKDSLPHVWVEAAQRHIDGYGMPVCPACNATWKPDSEETT